MKILYVPNRHTLNVLDQFTTIVMYNGNSTAQPVLIVNCLTANLFGLTCHLGTHTHLQNWKRWSAAIQ